MVILNLNFVLGVKVMIVMIVEPAIKEIWFEKWLFWPWLLAMESLMSLIIDIGSEVGVMIVDVRI